MAADRAWPRSVRVRTTAAAVGVLGVALLLSGAALVAGLHLELDRDLRAGAMVRAAEVARSVESGTDLSAVLAGDDMVQVLGAAGEVVAASPPLAGRPAMARLAPGESRTVALALDDDSYLVVAADAGTRTVLLARSRDDVSEPTQALIVLLGVGLPLLLLVVGATTWRLVGGALAPVDAIRAEVDAISAAALHRRVPLPATRDEIDRLAATMNRMLDRLERVRVRERAFIADASHELRSPIAAIRQHAEVALAHPDRMSTADLARVAHAESLRMQVLVDDLLLLARADEEGLRLSRGPVDLDDLVFAEAARLRAEPAVTIDTSAVSPVRVDGDSAALGRMLRNLVDNAARYADGRVTLTLAERDGQAVITVDDDGPGIPPADRKRVFDRFVRLDESRSRAGGGSGLGLAIVTEIAAAHGGEVALEDGPLGGARFIVRLPLRSGDRP
jgi:signal transduction histidine kinase